MNTTTTAAGLTKETLALGIKLSFSCKRKPLRNEINLVPAFYREIGKPQPISVPVSTFVVFGE